MSASTIVQFFLILGLLFSSIGGLVVASILKKLDNVVKVSNVTYKRCLNFELKSLLNKRMYLFKTL